MFFQVEIFVEIIVRYRTITGYCQALYLNKKFSHLFLLLFFFFGGGGGGGGGGPVGKPDIDVSRHLQKADIELWDGHEYSYSELQHVAN